MTRVEWIRSLTEDEVLVLLGNRAPVRAGRMTDAQASHIELLGKEHAQYDEFSHRRCLESDYWARQCPDAKTTQDIEDNVLFGRLYRSKAAARW